MENHKANKEESMDSFILAGGIVAAVTYIFLCIGIVMGTPQSFSTWILWAFIDVIAAISIASKGGSFLLPTVYAAGSTLIFVAILVKFRKFEWTWFETMIAGLVVICLAIYGVFGGTFGTIAATISVGIAGVPQFGEFWSKPEKNSWQVFMVYSGFLASNILTTLGGKNVSIQEIYYPLYCTVMCISIVYAIGRGIALKGKFSQEPFVSI